MEMYIAIAAGILSLVVAFALMTKVKGADEGNDQMKEMMKDKKKRERIGEELADTLIFSLRFAQMYAFDIDDIIRDKMVKNAVKYPKPEK